MNATSPAAATKAAPAALPAPVCTYEPTREQWDALQGQFEFFNARLFGGKLPRCMLNMSRHSKSYGFFAPDRWKRGAPEGDEVRTHEISLNPDHLGRDPRAVASTLVHEMVHLWQETCAKKKPTRGYHDKVWADKMESIGLMPSNTGAPGGKRTGKNMTHYVIEGGPFALAWKELSEAYKLPWRSGFGMLSDGLTPAPKKKKDPSKLKYTCPGCETNVWGKKGLKISCEEDGCAFEMEEIEEEE